MQDIKGLKLKIASPEDILGWSKGEVIKPETINYRSQRPEKDGLFSERIFGPIKDYECYCGKYKRIRYKGVTCDKCGVDVTRSSVRRERMGHISLACPVAHIWFLRVSPSKIGLFLDVPIQKLEKVIYYAAYIVTGVDDAKRKIAIEKAEKKIQDAAEGEEGEYLIFKEQLVALKVGKILSEADYYALNKEFPTAFTAGRGAEAVRSILEKVDLKKMVAKIEAELEKVKDATKEKTLLYRLKLARTFIKNKQRPEWMILTTLPVLPPDLRPMMALEGGRYATSDLNDLYRRVINRNNRLKKLVELRAPEVIVVNEKRMLQEAVDALVDNAARFGNQPQLSSQRRPLRSLADILKGKQGRFRQNLLGKRVDYSGRSVIVVGPELKLSQCGLPKKMALELFKPFVINKIIERGMAYNIRNANNLIALASPEIWEILEEVIADKKVLLNRAPTLHRLGIQAFSPVLIEELAIKIPPMVCTAFNADFDGDQMAVHLPLTDEAQKEATELMWTRKNLLKPATGEPITVPTQDIILGCYHLTKINPILQREKLMVFSDEREALLALDFGKAEINELVKVRISKKLEGLESNIIETSIGRLIFNSILPKDFRYVNDVMGKKSVQKVVSEIIEKYGVDFAWETLDAIKTYGFKYATVSGISWGMKDLIVPKEKASILLKAEKEIEVINSQHEEGLLTDFERKARVVEIWEKTKTEIAGKAKEALDPNGPVYATIDSGARGSWSQPIQMIGMKGLVQDPRGETIELPIKSSYKEGLGVLEFFINTHGARKGLTDTALKTASAGYLTRRLVDVVQDVIIREKDCHSKDSIEVYRADGEEFGYKFGQRVYGRVAAEDIKVDRKTVVKADEIIGREAVELIENSNLASIKVRSPITCKSVYGICSKCYGLDLGRNESVQEGEAVGIVAAQSIGEPGTQLTLRTFHSGGVAGADITHGLPRIQELFESRIPKGKAPLAEFDGVIDDIEEKAGSKIIRLIENKPTGKVKTKAKAKEYVISRAAISFVKPGDVVEKGTQLAEGSIDLKELFEFQSKEAVQRYIINEIQKIYVSEGTFISDKHIEVIVRQMFSRVVVKESGETDLVRGEVIEKAKFFEVNREAKKEGKLPAKAKQMLTGITKTALSTESYLSAASFQETARVLVKAAAEGKVDVLRGLKENVIIGRLIPAGTGRKKTKSA